MTGLLECESSCVSSAQTVIRQPFRELRRRPKCVIDGDSPLMADISHIVYNLTPINGVLQMVRHDVRYDVQVFGTVAPFPAVQADGHICVFRLCTPAVASLLEVATCVLCSVWSQLTMTVQMRWLT